MNTFAPVETVLADIRAGKMIVLVDDEHRENEGDLVIAAEFATAEVINFMARYGRGLICLALTQQRVEHLGLHLMSSRNLTRHQTAFTTSIEAREGVTTGISAFDRAHTIATAIDPAKGQHDIITPGHVFPLVARDGGVLVRAGHTEAAVDLARLTGCNPAGVICEIMNDDGSMARLPDLQVFAKIHGLNIGCIADLIKWRRRKETLVRCIGETVLASQYGGDFVLKVYANTLNDTEHLALVKGEITPETPVLVRMHNVNLLEDALGDLSSSKTGGLQAAMQRIGDEGAGVIVLLREPQPESLSTIIAGKGQPQRGALRDYGVGAQILLDLGVKRLRLLTNSSKTVVIAVEGYGLEIVGREPFSGVRG